MFIAILNNWRRHIALLSRFLLVTSVASCASLGRPPAIEIVESQLPAAGDPLAKFYVTVHAVLQVHEHPNEASRAAQNLAAVAACQENVVKIVTRIAASGVRAVVMEGLYGAGTLEQPQPVALSAPDDPRPPKAKWLLAGRSDLSVYGFELKPLNEFGVGVVDQFGEFLPRARELAGIAAGAMSAQDRQEFNQLIQDEVTRWNLWYAGVIPQRSFLALQTALAVALARRENQIQLVIGKQHWSDLVYAVNRNPDVRMRLIPHRCEDGDGQN